MNQINQCSEVMEEMAGPGYRAGRMAAGSPVKRKFSIRFWGWRPGRRPTRLGAADALARECGVYRASGPAPAPQHFLDLAPLAQHPQGRAPAAPG